MGQALLEGESCAGDAVSPGHSLVPTTRAMAEDPGRLLMAEGESGMFWGGEN